MNKQARSRKFSAKQSARLGAYLAAGLGAAATSTADAAIVNINIGPSGFNIGGVNAGLSLGSSSSAPNFPVSGYGELLLANQYNDVYEGLLTGLSFFGGYFATDSNAAASPTRFALNAPIDGSSRFADLLASFFKVQGVTSPNFGPGSYMGFLNGAGNYGWLEVTWDGTNFEILSGAYESDPGVAILAGNTGGGPAAVPEPGTWAAAALLAGGAVFARWRKRRDEAQKEAA